MRVVRPGQQYEPTAAEIRAACLEIQETWTPSEEQRRRGLRNVPRDIDGRLMGLTAHRLAVDVGEVD